TLRKVRVYYNSASDKTASPVSQCNRRSDAARCSAGGDAVVGVVDADSGELVHRFRWKWSSVGDAGADLESKCVRWTISVKKNVSRWRNQHHFVSFISFWSPARRKVAFR